VWFGVASVGIIGPYFFDDRNGHAVTVTSDLYVNMLNALLLPQVANHNLPHIWFQQDGVTAHTARQSMAVLQPPFRGRLVSRFGNINHPARSPDLTTPDFFLWGYLKSQVFATRPQTLAVQEIPLDMLNRVMQAFIREECVQRNGEHLHGVIFKTK
jgi:hypothetical protein